MEAFLDPLVFNPTEEQINEMLQQGIAGLKQEVEYTFQSNRWMSYTIGNFIKKVIYSAIVKEESEEYNRQAIK